MIATDRFAGLAERAAAGFGLDDARIAVVPHPIGGAPESELERFALLAVDSVMELLTRSQAGRGG